MIEYKFWDKIKVWERECRYISKDYDEKSFKECFSGKPIKEIKPIEFMSGITDASKIQLMHHIDTAKLIGKSTQEEKAYIIGINKNSKLMSLPSALKFASTLEISQDKNQPMQSKTKIWIIISLLFSLRQILCKYVMGGPKYYKNCVY